MAVKASIRAVSSSVLIGSDVLTAEATFPVRHGTEEWAGPGEGECSLAVAFVTGDMTRTLLAVSGTGGRIKAGGWLVFRRLARKSVAG